MKFAKMPEEPPPPPEPEPTPKKRGLSSDDSSGEESDTEDSDAEVGTSSGGEDSDSEAKRAHQLSYLQKQVRMWHLKVGSRGREGGMIMAKKGLPARLSSGGRGERMYVCVCVSVREREREIQ